MKNHAKALHVRRGAAATGTLAGTAVLAALAIGTTTSTESLRSANGERSATSSSPIAITSDDKFVWSVNPDNDSVSVFRVKNDKNKKVKEIEVGKEPWCVAIAASKNDDDDKRKSQKRNRRDDDDDDN